MITCVCLLGSKYSNALCLPFLFTFCFHSSVLVPYTYKNYLLQNLSFFKHIAGYLNANFQNKCLKLADENIDHQAKKKQFMSV